MHHHSPTPRLTALIGAALSAALALAGLTAGVASATTTATSAATSVTPNIAPVTSGTVSDVCSTPKKGYASCLAIRMNKGRTGFGVRDTTSTAPSGYGPSQLLSAYDLPEDGGKGTTIAIVDAFDDPDAASDLAVYREQFGLPALQPGQLRKVNQDGYPGDYPAVDPSWATEISLDLDMVSAIAPEANIILVEASSASLLDLGAAEKKAVALGASYVSNSYGGGESSLETQLSADYYDHPGVAIVASAGDGGYGVDYPAADSDVTAVGGTSLTRDSSTARGWTESVWSTSSTDGTGSGCSVFEPKPSFQTDTGCSKRTVADVSADADPETGVAVYDSFSDGGSGLGEGWGQFGGTSLAAPVITATYALGGPIAKGDYPNADPYKHTADLNDVTTGSTATCTPAYLCTAEPGYDGPTGLGTPGGTGAFTDIASGTLTGKVTGRSGKAVADAQIKVTGTDSVSTTTGSDGTYQVRLPAGSYTIAVSGYGFTSGTTTASISTGTTTSRSVALKADPVVTLSGTVTDGSGHGWPVQSSITVDYGYGTVTTRTSPFTGKYSVRVPGDASYQVQVAPEITGYTTTDATLTVGGHNTTRDFQVAADLLADEGSALGYTQHSSGSAQTFTSGTLPSGWTTATTGEPWEFLDENALLPGDGVATISDTNGTATDASLYTPLVSVPAGQSPEISFQAFADDGLAEADVSTDGGQTWQTEWTEKDGLFDGQVQFTLPSSDVARSAQLRFRYQAFDSATETGDEMEVTAALLGDAWLTPQSGGLVEGALTDGNTRDALDDVNVALDAATTTSAPLAGAGDGFYYLFAAAGRHTVTGTLLDYDEGKSTVTVTANTVTRANLVMPAGKLTTRGSGSTTVSKNGTATRTLTLTNTGDGAANVDIDQFSGSDPAEATAVSESVFPAAQQSAQSPAGTSSAEASAVQRFLAAKHGETLTPGTEATASTSSASGWSTLADLPAGTEEDVAGSYDGILYVGLGGDNAGNFLDTLYGYDPATKAWTKEASAPQAVAQPGYAVIGDKLYVTGGIGNGLELVTETQVYDMATNTWTTGAADPQQVGGTDAVLDGKLYSIGGLDPSTFLSSDVVSVYDPSTNTWSEAGSYPSQVTGLSCGAIDGALYCAGGDDLNFDAVSATYKYTPGDSRWQQVASLPTALANSSFTVADGELLVSAGTAGPSQFTTTVGYAYNPAENWWVPIPAAPTPEFGAAGALGFYTVGGETGASSVATAYQLPGYGQTARNSLPWLSLSKSTLTIHPGQKVTITIGLNAAKAGLSGSGTVTAAFGFENDTPYTVTPVTISLKVK